jgi:hypothetical protein
MGPSFGVRKKMPQDRFKLIEFNRELTEENIQNAISTGKIIGDLSDEMTSHTKGVLSLEVSLGKEGTVSFQLTPSNIQINRIQP